MTDPTTTSPATAPTEPPAPAPAPPSQLDGLLLDKFERFVAAVEKIAETLHAGEGNRAAALEKLAAGLDGVGALFSAQLSRPEPSAPNATGIVLPKIAPTAHPASAPPIAEPPHAPAGPLAPDGRPWK